MSCYAAVRSPALPHVMLRYGAVSCTSAYHATLLRVLLRFHTCVVLRYALPHVMLRYCAFSCASTHNATLLLLRVLLRFQTCVVLRYCAFSCTFTWHATLLCGFLRLHMSCYATVRSPVLPHVMIRYGAVSCASNISCYATACSSALPHMRCATPLCVLMRFHTYILLCSCAFSCASTCHATLLCVLLCFHT